MMNSMRVPRPRRVVVSAILLAAGVMSGVPGRNGLPGVPVAAQGARPMTLVDLIELPRIIDPQLSPDGRFVSYTLSRADWASGRQIPHIWVRPVSGGAPVQRTNGSGEDVARWSPDSKTLLFRAGNQIHLVPAEGGSPRQLTTHVTNVLMSPSPTTLPTWAPDGSAIYFVAADVRSGAQRGAADSGVTIFGQTDFAQQHLWKVTIASGGEEKVTTGDWSVLGYRLSRDGRRLAVLRTPTSLAIDHYRSEVWVMDVNGANARALTTNGLYELDAELSPDNSQVWFLADANEKLEPYYGQTLFVMPSSGGTPQMLLPNLGHPIDSAVWGPDGKAILAIVNLGVHQEIYRIDVASRTAKPLTDGRHAMPTPTLSLAVAANRLIVPLDEPTRLGDAWTIPVDGGTPTRVTGVYDSLAADFALPRQESVTWKGADGITIEGLLFYPLGYREGTRVPLVVQLHGGPAESDKYGFGSNFIFNQVPVLTAKGYAVFRPNYRGSNGYGSAFVRDIIGHYFNNMHLDVLAGVDALIARGIVDPNRLALAGTSAGAHLVNKLITFTDRFKAASSAAGVANWISLMAQTDAVTRRTFWMGGTPWQKDGPFELLWNHSPIKDVWRVKTPTLFIAGGTDGRIPKEQALEMYRGLESNGVPTKLIIGNTEGHQWFGIRNLLWKDNQELEWFEKYVMNRPYQWETAPIAPAAPAPSR